MADDPLIIRSISQIPEDKGIGDLLPAFKGIKGEFRLGEPNQECACCRKPFSNARKPRRVCRLYPVWVKIPVIVELRICGNCYAIHQRGGVDREAVIAAIEAFCFDETQQ